MITKTVEPIVKNDKVLGTIIEYRIFGLLVYKKTLHTPLITDRSEFTWFIPKF